MRIAVIDSDEAYRRLVQKAIKESALKSGAEIVGEASDGRAGYQMILDKRPDLVIADLDLPKLSGLSMLRRLRAERVDFRILVISAERDFQKARQVIKLGADDYLLKPVKRIQLQRVLQNIEEKIISDQILRGALSPESVFSGCINGQVRSDERLNKIIYERYGFTLDDEGAVLAVWLGNGYTENREQVGKILERCEKMVSYELCVLFVDVWRLAAVIVYDRNGESREKDAYEEIRNKVIPCLKEEISGELVCMWAEMQRLENVLDSLAELYRIREWNLLFDRGVLISRKDIENMQPVPMKYPMDLEDQLRHAVIAADADEMQKCYYKLYDFIRQSVYAPREIKECLIRINMAVLSAYKTCREIKSELRLHRSMQGITEAASWGQIRAAMEEFFHGLDIEAHRYSENDSYSPLIRKAVRLLERYYDQGITLDEMAEQLFVSEEYLSTQFKKETGYGFKETVKKMRIEKIKELLGNTHLKLNQIAELTGYNDPKYMSRVFKEEVGMLPTEFRKEVH